MCMLVDNVFSHICLSVYPSVYLSVQTITFEPLHIEISFLVWKYMSHFHYSCKMQCPLNLVFEYFEYLWFYLTFWIAILDCGLKLHKLSIHTLVMLEKGLEIH